MLHNKRTFEFVTCTLSGKAKIDFLKLIVFLSTSGNFTNIILKNTKMLHYSGNGSEQQLLLETSCAAGVSYSSLLIND